MPMTADQLIAFALLVDSGSVTAAARELNVSQPAVSGRLRSLQTLTGQMLYSRSGSSIELTPAGEALLPTRAASPARCDRPSTRSTHPAKAQWRRR